MHSGDGSETLGGLGPAGESGRPRHPRGAHPARARAQNLCATAPEGRAVI